MEYDLGRGMKVRLDVAPPGIGQSAYGFTVTLFTPAGTMLTLNGLVNRQVAASLMSNQKLAAHLFSLVASHVGNPAPAPQRPKTGCACKAGQPCTGCCL